MFSISKTGEGYYIATLRTNNTVLKRVECTQLKHALSDVVRPHREISIDIKGIKAIEKEGFRILEELKKRADTKNCRIRFINVDPQVSPAVKKLSEKKVQLQDEIEQL
jgi:anti-anti-sigma regulatory factor